MGYDTVFHGAIRVEPPLGDAERQYLARFARTRHVARHSGPYATADDLEPAANDLEPAGDDPDDVVDVNLIADGKPGYWCDWLPTPDGHLALPDGPQRVYCAPEWLVYLRDHFLGPGGHAQGLPGFAAFTFDHSLTGAVAARGQIEGDRWTLRAADGVIGVVREHLPCAACWVDGVRAVTPPSAAYRFTHPEPAGNVDPLEAVPGQRDPFTIGPPERCRAGGYQPAVTWQPAIWPLPAGGPLRPPWEARFADLLEPGAVLEYRVDDERSPGGDR